MSQDYLMPLALIRQYWKTKNYTVGFTNGCFDLFHDGHRHLLSEARKQCDRLVVGINEDASVRRIKGDGRPINPQEVRKEDVYRWLKADRYDPRMGGVLIFRGDSPIDAIRVARPHILFKGADYEGVEITGSEFVSKTGGKTVLIPLLNGHSTTAQILSLSCPALSF